MTTYSIWIYMKISISESGNNLDSRYYNYVLSLLDYISEFWLRGFGALKSIAMGGMGTKFASGWCVCVRRKMSGKEYTIKIRDTPYQVIILFIVITGPAPCVMFVSVRFVRCPPLIFYSIFLSPWPWPSKKTSPFHLTASHVARAAAPPLCSFARHWREASRRREVGWRVCWSGFGAFSRCAHRFRCHRLQEVHVRGDEAAHSQ